MKPTAGSSIMVVSAQKQILVADDDQSIRTLISELLSEAGYLVDIASNGIEAINKLSRNTTSYDMIILDVNMPGMRGIALCREVTARFLRLNGRFLFITGNLTPDVASFLKENAYQYITKPFTMSQLWEQVHNILRRGGKILERETAMGKHVERRTEERFLWSTRCSVYNNEAYGSMPLMAETQDISQNGVRIHYLGEPINPDELVIIHIDDLKAQRNAKVMWSKAVNTLNTQTGLRLAEPVPLPKSIGRVSRQTL
jgi:DNA-binding response OmpR family regulator